MKNLKDVNIFLIGDFMLDKYIVGEVKRISPEAPVPVVLVKDEFSTLGGAGNVARNIRSIGSAVRCVGLTGFDKEGQDISDMLLEIGADDRTLEELETTIVKQRVIADQRKVQMLRLDWEDPNVVPDDLSEMVIEQVNNSFNKSMFDYIVVSDYAKGIISRPVMEHLHTLGLPIIIDPKPKNSRIYGRVELLTPNQEEWSEMQIHDDGFSAEFVLVTEGKDGMTLYDYRQGWAKCKIEGTPVEVYNVSGAGDTVLAVMAICLSMDIYPDKAARIANDCAAYVVTKSGTSTITENKFTEIMQSYVR